MCFVVNTTCTCLGQRRTYATSRLLSFSTPQHPMCPCFLHSSPHMQHRVQCELAHKPINCASTLKGFTACKLLSFVPRRLENCNSNSVLEKSKLCENETMIYMALPSSTPERDSSRNHSIQAAASSPLSLLAPSKDSRI